MARGKCLKRKLLNIYWCRLLIRMWPIVTMNGIIHLHNDTMLTAWQLIPALPMQYELWIKNKSPDNQYGLQNNWNLQNKRNFWIFHIFKNNFYFSNRYQNVCGFVLTQNCSGIQTSTGLISSCLSHSSNSFALTLKESGDCLNCTNISMKMLACQYIEV